ncbi:MAG TPA: hypothetical protein VKT28_18690 [Puia sp.]|nr:hypothetical protein [Puia sp.]
MAKFFALMYYRFKMLLKDDFSAMAVVAYLLSLNVFTIIGCYKCVFQHSHLSKLPLFYALIIMLVAGVFTRFVLLGKVWGKNIFKERPQRLRNEKWMTFIYVVASFGLMIGFI